MQILIINLLTLWPRLLLLLLLHYLLLCFVPLYIDICILNHHVISDLLLLFKRLLLSHFKRSLFPFDEISSVLRCYLLSLHAVGSVCCDELILVDVECLATGRRLAGKNLWIFVGAALLIVFIVVIINEVAIIVHVESLADSFDLIFVLALSLFRFYFLTFLNTSDIWSLPNMMNIGSGQFSNVSLLELAVLILSELDDIFQILIFVSIFLFLNLSMLLLMLLLLVEIEVTASCTSRLGWILIGSEILTSISIIKLRHILLLFIILRCINDLVNGIIVALHEACNSFRIINYEVINQQQLSIHLWLRILTASCSSVSESLRSALSICIRLILLLYNPLDLVVVIVSLKVWGTIGHWVGALSRCISNLCVVHSLLRVLLQLFTIFILKLLLRWCISKYLTILCTTSFLSSLRRLILIGYLLNFLLNFMFLFLHPLQNFCIC